jgi:hypothetical protein
MARRLVWLGVTLLGAVVGCNSTSSMHSGGGGCGCGGDGIVSSGGMGGETVIANHSGSWSQHGTAPGAVANTASVVKGQPTVLSEGVVVGSTGVSEGSTVPVLGTPQPVSMNQEPPTR